MLSFKEFLILQESMKLQQTSGMFPPHMNAVARRRALRTRWQGMLKAKSREASQRLLMKQKQSGVSVKSELDEAGKTQQKPETA
jgi:hypothetical protein